MSGLMGHTGFPDGPPVMTNSPVIDRITALHAAIGALGALHHRDRTGQGQSLDVCLLDTGYTLMEIPIAQYLLTGKEPERHGNTPGGVAPCNTFEAQDGWVYILAIPQHMWVRFCKGMDREDLATDERFSSLRGRAAHAQEINTIVEDWVRHQTVSEVVKRLKEAEVPVGPVHSIAEAANDAHLWDRGMLVHHLFRRRMTQHRLDRAADLVPMHAIYVDEVQDLTQAELMLLMACSRNPNGLVLVGDTAHRRFEPAVTAEMTAHETANSASLHHHHVLLEEIR